MTLLLLFAFLAGIATVLSPCVLPVLPAILAAGTGRGTYRPLGVISGMVVSFSFFTLALTAIVNATGLPANWLRDAAMIILVLFGLVMLIPSLSDWFAAVTSKVASLGTEVQAQGKQAGEGFAGGFLLGIALGLLWTPCAGPILAAITTLAATSQVTTAAILLTIAYALGAALPLFLIAYGGQRVLNSSRFLSKHTETIRQGFGVLMIITAAALWFHFDTKLQQWTLDYFPSASIEDNPLVRQELVKLRGGDEKSPFAPVASTPGKKSEALPLIGHPPELMGIVNWINSKPLTLEQLHGKVVLIDFWTYSCINCLRTLPYLTHWYDTYKDKGLVVIGVHTPEFEFEKETKNVTDATQRLKITYPVAQDNNYKTWSAFHNIYWPAHYLIDRDGIVRQIHFGEGGYMETENAIRSLLGLAPIAGKEIVTSQRSITSETYLGYKRAAHYTSDTTEQMERDRAHLYIAKAAPEQDEVALRGPWIVEEDRVTADGADSFLELNFLAPRVYLVMSSKHPAYVTVKLDGQPLPKEFYTSDMDDHGRILVKEARKYDILNLHMHYERHSLTLHLAEGISAYAFTFGDEE